MGLNGAKRAYTGGLVANLIHSMDINILRIEKGWYWSAGDRWGWTQDGYERAGVGIAKPLLLLSDTLQIEVHGKLYTLDCTSAVDFIRKYKSFYDVKPDPRTGEGTRLGVVSKSLLVQCESTV